MGMDALHGSAHGQKNSRLSDAEVSGLGHAEVPWKERNFSGEKIMVLRRT